MALVLLALPLAGLTVQAATPADRPNVLLIVNDDLGWGDLSCYPQRRDWGPDIATHTPNLDRLAAEGVRFTDAYATSPVCAPSRAALLTGRYQQRFGYYAFEETMAAWPRGVQEVQGMLRDEGYATALIGKWHISFPAGSRPLDRGFERFYGFLGGQHDYFDPNLGQPLQRVDMAQDAPTYDQHQPVKEVHYLTDELTDRAVSWIEEQRRAGRPFFLYLAYNAPHPPMQAEWSDLAPYMKGKKSKTDFTERDLARAMLDNLDRNIGRLLAFLNQAKLEDKTLVIHTSDNGGHDEGPGRVVQHNGGLRPRKGLLYEGGIRVPMMIRWPGRIPAGVTSSHPVSHLDVVPTILAAVRARPDPTRTLDGVDLLPIIAAPARGVPPERNLYWGFDHKSRWAVRSGPWKLVYESTNIPNWHLIFDAAKPTTPVAKDAPPVKVLQLYHLADDPAEAHNVAAAHPEVVERLQRSIDTFYASTRPSLYTPEVRRQHEAILAERAKDPALANIKRRDGVPGLWRVGD